MNKIFFSQNKKNTKKKYLTTTVAMMHNIDTPAPGYSGLPSSQMLFKLTGLLIYVDPLTSTSYSSSLGIITKEFTKADNSYWQTAAVTEVTDDIEYVQVKNFAFNFNDVYYKPTNSNQYNAYKMWAPNGVSNADEILMHYVSSTNYFADPSTSDESMIRLMNEKIPVLGTPNTDNPSLTIINTLNYNWDQWN